MGGQMMGLYELRLPIRRDFKPKQGGMVGAFLLGLFFRGCLFTLRDTGAGGDPDLCRHQGSGTLRHGAAFYSMHWIIAC